MRTYCVLIVLVMGLGQAQAQTFLELFGLENNFSAPGVVPHGCLSAQPAVAPIPDESQIFYDQSFTVTDGTFTSDMRIRSWRIGCHEPNRSVIAVNFNIFAGDSINSYPQVMIKPERSNEEFFAGLFFHSMNNLVNAAGISDRLMLEEPLFDDGVTLVVDTTHLSGLTLDQYNSALTLELDFLNGQVNIPVPAYDPMLDPTQTPLPSFHGRYSGQWVVDGLPSSGLVLQIGEIPETERNFVFAIWFTYFDGEPSWVVGNRDLELGSNEISIDMSLVEGGEFFTDPGSFTQDDIAVSSAGTMIIRANNCNEIEADLDFTPIGRGSTTLTFDRLIRIAGYDCDQTQ